MIGAYKKNIRKKHFILRHHTHSIHGRRTYILFSNFYSHNIYDNNDIHDKLSTKLFKNIYIYTAAQIQIQIQLVMLQVHLHPLGSFKTIHVKQENVKKI